MTDTTNLISKISRIAANVLGLDPSDLSIDANLFEQGLDSIITIHLVVLLSEELRVEIRVLDIFENQTIESLAELLKRKMQDDNTNYQQTLEYSLRERE